ncbi:unnamed protein product [Caenorhabditis angaria]|uniref:Peptidase S54 rhomboid domain-containing protein n=1 Tax=Caenorhabditis angaria TaxID=860376 RepID=A0A9P1IF64_9PELO|nr:unnamed protein product [Caenorhabditis angaria]
MDYTDDIYMTGHRRRPAAFWRYLSSLVLTTKQLSIASNGAPFFMILMIMIEIFYIIKHIESQHAASVLWSAHCALHLFVQIILGIPLEVAYGSSSVGFLYISSQCYSALIVSILENAYRCIGSDAACFALISLHCTNIVENWYNFTMKYTRLLIMFLMTFPIIIFYSHIETHIRQIEYGRYAAHPYHGILASCWIGFLFAHFWMHRDRERRQPWWRPMTVILLLLLYYIIFAQNLFGIVPKQTTTETPQNWSEHDKTVNRLLGD